MPSSSSSNNNNPASGRPRSPTAVASTVHPSGCTCGCLHVGFPKAIYRNYRGVETFTGVLMLDSEMTLWKLNDPHYDFEEGATLASLAGTGHLMGHDEFIMEMALYDLKDGTPSSTVPIKKNIPFVDFSDKPDDFLFKERELEIFDVKFPHGTLGRNWVIPEIRADDTVKVMVSKHIHMAGQNANERLWVNVIGVTNTMLVVGSMSNSIESPLIRATQFPDDLSEDPKFKVKEGDLVAFPVTCVLGVEHGENW